MEMNKELLAKAKTAKSPEELLALADENGINLTEEKAKEYFRQLCTQSDEISDDELDNVSGGCGGGDERPQPRYAVGQTVACYYYFGIGTMLGSGIIRDLKFERNQWFYVIDLGLSGTYTIGEHNILRVES